MPTDVQATLPGFVERIRAVGSGADAGTKREASPPQAVGEIFERPRRPDGDLCQSVRAARCDRPRIVKKPQQTLPAVLVLAEEIGHCWVSG